MVYGKISNAYSNLTGSIVALSNVKEVIPLVRARLVGRFWHVVEMRSLVKITFGLARRATGTNGSPRYTGGMRNDRSCNAMQTSHCRRERRMKVSRGNAMGGRRAPRHKAHRKILNRRKRSPKAPYRCRLPRATTPGALYWAENSAIKDISGAFVLLRGRNAFLPFRKRLRRVYAKKKAKWIREILIQPLHEYGNFLTCE